jgi:DNA-binding MarR family transcriptional regulator
MGSRAPQLDPVDCVCAGLRKASRAVTQLYDSELRASGIRSTQFAILSAIDAAGEANIAELTEELLLDQTTLTRSLRLLEEMSLIQQVPKSDARLKTVKLTSKGRDVLTSAKPLWRNAQKKILKALGSDQWAETQQRLRLVARTAQKGR